MSQGADPLRMMYVGILTTLLLLTGCFGLVEDDVIDSTSGEVTDQQFSDLENRVFDVETLAASHTTDITDLDARVTLIEANMITMADVMAALPPGADLSDYLTSSDIASLISDAQAAQTAIQMSAADIAALEQDVADLEADLQAMQNANPGAGGSSYPPLIEDWGIQIQSPYYLNDANLANLGAIYPDALNQEVLVNVYCQIYDVEANALDTVGLDLDHDGVIDENINVQWDSDLERYNCDDQLLVANADVTYETDDGGRIYLIAALGVEDDTGAWAWDASWAYSYDIVIYEEWMELQFTVLDHPDTLAWNSYDGLFTIQFNDNSGNVPGVRFGPSPDSYLSQHEYRILVEVSASDNWLGNTWCQVVPGNYVTGWDDCVASSGIHYATGEPILIDGWTAQIYENEGYSWLNNNGICQSDWYNDGYTCNMNIAIHLYVMDYNLPGTTFDNEWDHVNSFHHQLAIS